MALKNNGKYDIWMNDLEMAKTWGRKLIKIKIYE